MEEDTPNIHTPPEGHATPPPAPPHPHHNDDMEQALHDSGHHHEEPPMLILDRRLAKGEISMDEYLKTKEVLHPHK